jgi:hypothetical protein
MKKIFPWYLVLQGHEIAMPEGSVLPLELTRRLSAAMKIGTINVFSEDGKLLPPPANIDLSHHLHRNEVNSWYKKNHYPYLWDPITKEKPRNLKDLVTELEDAALNVVKVLRANGYEESQLTIPKVSSEIAKGTLFSRFELSSIEYRVKRGWWRSP